MLLLHQLRLVRTTNLSPLARQSSWRWWCRWRERFHCWETAGRERLRERGFGVTNYEWVKGALGTRLMVPLTRRGNFALPPIKTFISLAWVWQSLLRSFCDMAAKLSNDKLLCFRSASASILCDIYGRLFWRVWTKLGADNRRWCWKHIYVQDGSELRLRVASSHFVDPKLSADGYSIAYVCDEERFVLPISVGEPKQITFATQETGKVRCCFPPAHF